MSKRFVRAAPPLLAVVAATLLATGCDSKKKGADDGAVDLGGHDQAVDVDAQGGDGDSATADGLGGDAVPDLSGDAFLPAACGSEAVKPLFDDPPNPSPEPRQVTTVAGGTRGTADGQGNAAQFDRPRGIARGDDGLLYLTDCNNHLIRRIDPATWQVTTVAGSAAQKGSEDGTGSEARFDCPWALVSLDGMLYVADTYNSTIRRVDPDSGAVTTVAGKAGEHSFRQGSGDQARFSRPTGITTDGRHLYVADSSNHVIRRLDPISGAVRILAGAVSRSGHVDGSCQQARFTNPGGMAADGPRLFVSDAGSGTIRAIDVASGEVSTLAGKAFTLREHADGTGEEARFFFPAGLATDGTNLFVADSNNRIIRQITISSGTVTTIAGAPGLTPTQEVLDGVGAGARFSAPSSLAMDGADLVVVDWLDNRIRLLESE